MAKKTDSSKKKTLAAKIGALPRAFFDLARLAQPAGIVLLLLPALFALALAAPANQAPDAELCLLFTIGAILMRASGCAVNDIFDRKLDAKVERTKNRPVASGAIPVWGAWMFAAVTAGCGYYIASEMGVFTRYLALMTLPLIVAYPFMKRITWWPQAWLAITFNWGALLGFAAALGHLTPVAFVLYAACSFWTLGYDTIYAFQDVEDDKKAGIKSTARLLGSKARMWVSGWYGAFFVLMLLAGAMAHMNYTFYAGMGLALYHLNRQLEFWKPEDPHNSAAIFRANMVLGFLVFASLIAGRTLP